MASVGLDAFYDFVEDPARSAEAARKRPPIALALAAYVAAAVGLFAAQGLAGKHALLGVSWPALGLSAAWTLGVGAVFSSVVHLAAEAAGGRGSALALFSLFGFARLGWALSLPAVLLLKAVAPDAAWSASLLFALVGLWVLVLETRSVRLLYGFGRARAAAVVLAPYAAVCAAALLAVAAAAWSAFYHVMRLASS